MSFINQYVNNFGIIPTATVVGFVCGQIGAFAMKKPPLSPFAILNTMGATFLTYGYLQNNTAQFLKDDFNYLLSELEKIPAVVENAISSLKPAPKETTFFGIPL